MYFTSHLLNITWCVIITSLMLSTCCMLKWYGTVYALLWAYESNNNGSITMYLTQTEFNYILSQAEYHSISLVTSLEAYLKEVNQIENQIESL